MRDLLPREIDAVEILDARNGCGVGQSVLITCEHASNELPAPYQWSENDLVFKDTHWAYDPGAKELTTLLAQKIGGFAILSKQSRLLLDPNRHLAANSLFRKECEGVQLDLNSNLNSDEVYERIMKFHVPYFLMIGEAAQEQDPWLSISMHTFTPCYCGQLRDVQIGLLHEDADQETADAFFNRFQEAGYDVRHNEPWDGRQGLMTANMACCTYVLGTPRRRGIEFEIRNDLATDPVEREKIVDVLVSAINDLHSVEFNDK